MTIGVNCTVCEPKRKQTKSEDSRDPTSARAATLGDTA